MCAAPFGGALCPRASGVGCEVYVRCWVLFMPSTHGMGKISIEYFFHFVGQKVYPELLELSVLLFSAVTRRRANVMATILPRRLFAVCSGPPLFCHCLYSRCRFCSSFCHALCAKVQRGLHVVFTMNPASDGFAGRCATSPALFNRCVVDWFGTWPTKALAQVSNH